MRGGRWSGVIGSWTVPTAAPSGLIPPEVPLGFWASSSAVALDGFEFGENATNDRLLAGVRYAILDAFKNPTPVYRAFVWWMGPGPNPYADWYPIAAVQPGDQVLVSVSYFAGGAIIHFVNETSGQYFPIALNPTTNPSAAGSSVS